MFGILISFSSIYLLFKNNKIDGMTVEKFLKIIGRDCHNHAKIFKSWDDLMLMKTRDLKKAGVALKQRKWILRWVEKYKQGLEPKHVSKIRSDVRKNKDLKKLIPPKKTKELVNPYLQK